MTDKITVDQVKEMFEMQDAMNSKVYPDWKTKGFDWHLAAQMELMEGVEHYGYKWWKKQEPDLPQVQLEVVDAWHFWLSEFLVSEWGDYERLAEVLNLDINLASDKKTMYFDLAQNYLEEEGTEFFWSYLLWSVGLTPAKLYEMYVQKNVLNFFRQDNGYKEGTYVKTWLGVEDNVQLLTISDQLKEEGMFNKENLYAALEQMYSLVK